MGMYFVEDEILSKFLFFMISLVLGIIIQSIKKFPVLSTIGVQIGFILAPLMTIEGVMNIVTRTTGLNNIDVMTFVILYSIGTSTPIIIFKFNNIKKMENHIKYSQYFVDEKIQKFLDEMKNEFLQHEKYYGKIIFISYFYIKRGLLGNRVIKLARVGHSGLPGILSEHWDGTIKKYKKCSTGLAVENKYQNFVVMNKTPESELSGLPDDILTWSKSNIKYRINIPFIKEDNVQFVIAINGIDPNFSLDMLRDAQIKVLLQHAFKIAEKYENNMRYLDKYFNCLY